MCLVMLVWLVKGLEGVMYLMFVTVGSCHMFGAARLFAVTCMVMLQRFCGGDPSSPQPHHGTDPRLGPRHRTDDPSTESEGCCVHQPAYAVDQRVAQQHGKQRAEHR